DRERVVEALQEQVGEGRLTLAEFEQRSTEAYSTCKTVADLRARTKDLPGDPLAPPKPPLASWQQPWPMPAVAPWAQRTYPPNRGYSGPPLRGGVNPVRVAVTVLITMWIVALVVGSAFLHFPFLPLVFLVPFLVARGGRRRFR
ncbi:MAG TPA: DUF1707 domain-containing protein, partial [Pseudonocardiaceae bacterium]